MMNFRNSTNALFSEIVSFLESIDADFTYDGKIIKIDFNNSEYIINKHEFNQEVWLSSPKSGPYHFRYSPDNKLWMDAKGNEVFGLIKHELSPDGHNW